MKKVIELSLILFLLLPSVLWVRNLYSHQLMAESIRNEIADSARYARISRGMVPFQRSEDVLGISQSDRYAYSFTLDEGEAAVRWRDNVLAGSKLILPGEDDIILVTQENGIRYSSIQLFRYDPAARTTLRLNEPRLVRGTLGSNAVIHDGWVYYWYHTTDMEIFAVAFRDGIFHEFRLPELYHAEVNSIGFNQTYPRIANCPVLEINRGGDIVYYALDEDREPRASRGRHPMAGQVDPWKLDFLYDQKSYSRFWLMKGKLAGLDGRMVKVFDLPDLDQSDEFQVWDPNIHALIEQGGEIVAIPDNQSARLKADIRDSYLQKTSQAEARLERYIAEDLLSGYITTPTSLGLILLQIILVLLGIRLFDRKEMIS